MYIGSLWNFDFDDVIQPENTFNFWNKYLFWSSDYESWFVTKKMRRVWCHGNYQEMERKTRTGGRDEKCADPVDWLSLILSYAYPPG